MSHVSTSRVVAITILSAFAFVLVASNAANATATECRAPNSSGTVVLPTPTPTANCPGGFETCDQVYQIVDGLTAGDTIDIDAVLTNVACGGGAVCSFTVSPSDCNDPGGPLGGDMGCADAVFTGNMQGTGTLSGFSRLVSVPMAFEMHTAPRVPGSPIQSFDTDMFRLFGQIANPGAGDPDFDLLRITGGTNFGLSSPGHTLLGRDPLGFQVDSFFDITYRIDFVGRSGGTLSGKSGSTTRTIRIHLGDTITTVTTSTTTTTTTITTTTTTTMAPVVYDHLECFKVKDTLRVEGTVDLPTLAGTPYDAAGCIVGAVKKFCTPAVKTVLSSTPPATPMPGPDLTSDYICYKLKCPTVDLSQNASDQWGAHSLSKMKQGELCVPAVRTP